MIANDALTVAALKLNVTVTEADVQVASGGASSPEELSILRKVSSDDKLLRASVLGAKVKAKVDKMISGNDPNFATDLNRVRHGGGAASVKSATKLVVEKRTWWWRDMFSKIGVSISDPAFAKSRDDAIRILSQ